MICNLADAMVVIREDYAEIERLRGQVAKLEAENAALKEEVQMVRNANSLLSEQFMKFQDAVTAQQTWYGPIPEDKR